jgi:DNA-binding FadR family transcriptional regulator
MTRDAEASPRPDGPGLRRRKLALLVADAITEDILDARLEPETVLPPEERLMRRFDVGRGTLREALRLLEAEGLLRVRPGRGGGPVVQAPPADLLARPLSVLLSVAGSSFASVVEARRAVEPALARYAASRATDEERQQISQSVHELRDVLGHERRFLAVNSRFHTIIADAAHSPTLAAVWRAIEDISDGQQAGVRYDEKRQAAIMRMHHRIADSIAGRDAERAAADMERHLDELVWHLKVHYPELLDGHVQTIGLRAT